MDLLKKENFLQLVLNTIPIYVFWKDRNSIYLGCNQNFATSAKLQLPDDIVGKSDYDLPWSKEDSDFYRKIDKEVMDSKYPANQLRRTPNHWQWGNKMAAHQQNPNA